MSQAPIATIRDELEAYGHGLAEKPEIVALNKIDAIDPDAIAPAKRGAGEAPPGERARCSPSPARPAHGRCSRPARAQRQSDAADAQADPPMEAERCRARHERGRGLAARAARREDRLGAAGPADGEIRADWLAALADDVAALPRRGQEVHRRLVRGDRGGPRALGLPGGR